MNMAHPQEYIWNEFRPLLDQLEALELILNGLAFMGWLLLLAAAMVAVLALAGVALLAFHERRRCGPVAEEGIISIQGGNRRVSYGPIVFRRGRTGKVGSLPRMI